MTQPNGKQPPKKKILEPTFHFAIEQLKIGEDASDETIPVAELVTAGQKLIDFPNFDKLAGKNYEKAPVEAADFVSANEQEHSFLASVYGYPKIKKIRKPEIEGMITTISVEPLFKFSPDNMTVALNIHPPLKDKYSLKSEDLRKLIRDHGICFGIIDSALEEVAECIDNDENEFRTIIIAKGRPPGISHDAYLRYELEIGPIAGLILDDGSIDFRERKIMVPVAANQLIATKIPPTQGDPGTNVLGEQIPAREGKDIKINVQDDVRFSPQTRQVTATKNGVLSIVQNNIIKVCAHQVIRSDIDYETGNVESLNSITVQGNVQPAFKVVVGGELKVTGSVMSATLVSESNLVVQGGVTGKNSTVTAKGDADINFIEQGKLSAGGLVVIRKQAYYSEVVAGGDIRCHKSSIIIGGRLISEGSISLGDVGGEDSVPTQVAAGVVANRLDYFTELKQSIVAQQEEIIQWLQRYRGSSRSKKVRKMEMELDKNKQALLRVNMIPGSGKYSRVATTEPSQKNDPDYLDTDAIEIANITIDVYGTIQAGTEIQIGNVNLRLDKTVSGRRFKLHNNLKRILATPLKRK